MAKIKPSNRDIETELREEIRRLSDALGDLANNGTRYDLTPVRIIKATPEVLESETWWSGYVGAADAYVRDYARRALRGKVLE